MILTRSCFILLGLTAFQGIGISNVLASDEAQTCINLCESCDGIATFQHNICQCHVADDNDQGAECIGRMRRQAQDLGVDIVSCDLANAEADRPARCAASPLRRLRTRGNADLIARYFMGNGLSSLLGSQKPEAESTADSDSSSTVENVGANAATSGDTNMDSAVVGAPNQFLQTDPYMMGVMTNWLQPQNMMSIDESCQGAGGGPEIQSYVGQTNPEITSMTDNESMNQNIGTNSAQTNFVGEPNHDETGQFSSGRMYDSYNMLPLMLGTNPYAYFIRTPYPAQFPGGSQMSGTRSYYYQSMDGGRNSQSRENNIVGLSPYSNCHTSSLGASNPNLGDSAAAQGNSPDKGAMPNEQVGEANPEGLNHEDREYLGSNGQIDKDVRGDPAGPEEIKDQTVGSSKYKLRRRLNKFRSKDSRSMSDADSCYGNSDATHGVA
ncbi:uncharacterized protein LOC124408024 [Diprion similis]|uniref:uncharacterized protein LOC124408024 n=1 Tax=Diprion similis TaxID=362088 RepID=UPI001EF8DB56|nr:uncharacterized protein LOC124408024 [Diprion similis]